MAEPAGRRRTATLAVLVVLGAAAAAGAAALTWWTQSHVDTLAGVVTTSAKGAKVDALLVPVALVALAGFGAALATGGIVRRVVGLLLVLGGGWTAVSAVIGLFTAPASLHGDLTRPAQSSGPAQVHPLGPLLAALGGFLLVAAGVMVAAGVVARRALGSRYDAPVSRRRTRAAVARGSRTATDPAADADVAAGWWKALDAGQDPTEATVQTADRRLTTDHGLSDDVTRGV